MAALVGSVLAVQLGASFSRRLIDQTPTPLGAVWLRLTSALAIMLVYWIVRWVLRRRSRCQLSASATRETRVVVASAAAGTAKTRISRVGGTGTVPVSGSDQVSPARPRYALALTIVFGAVMLGMNAAIYEAFARIPVGLAITLEFLGPLGVAIVISLRRRPREAAGARWRSLVFDLGLVACAGVGVALLGLGPVSLNLQGTLFALTAAACWASYIVLGSRVARWHSSDRVLTVLWVVAAVVFLGPALAPSGAGFLTPGVIWLALGVGLACSVVPSLLELFVLARVPPALFAILESLAPAVAGLGAWIILKERLHLTDWVAIVLVVIASVGATWSNARAA